MKLTSRGHAAIGSTCLLSAICIMNHAAVIAAPVVANGDFETDASSFTTSPGYTGDAGNPASITSWTGGGAGRVGVNPGSFGSNPFNDNGSNATNVGFLQANPSPTTLSQTISGFTPGSTYNLTYSYNARNCCGDNPNLSTSIGSKTTTIDNIQSVGGANPMRSVTIPFTATAASQTLTLTASNHGGDATATVDNFTIAEVTKIPIVNPSFELDSNPGVGYGPITGWTGGSGTNPGAAGNFFIPGRTGPVATPPDGSQVAFIQGGGTLSQVINGLVPGTTYTLSFFEGHRNGDSGPGDTIEALIDGASLGTETPSVAEYRPHAYTFVAAAASQTLSFVHGNVTGDQSISIDDVAITTVVPVPEPASLTMIGAVGALALAKRRRR